MTGFEKVTADFAPVTAVLTEFVQTFDVDYSVELAPDFEADNITDTIKYAVAMMESGAIAFRNNFIKRFPLCADFDIFTLSFMHELGHLETEWDMVDDTIKRIALHKSGDEEAYFNLHNEKIATDWAGEYLTENHDDMKNWEAKVLALLKEVLDTYPDE